MPYEKSKIQQEKLDTMTKRLKNLAESYQESPENIIEVLKFKAKFHEYSYRNNALIFKQNKFATFVAGFDRFKKMGYSVLKGEKGMNIFCPCRVDYVFSNEAGDYIPISKASPALVQLAKHNMVETKTVTYYKVGTVFDISQTTCPPSDYPKYYSMGYENSNKSMLYEAIKKFAKEKLKCSVEEADVKSISRRGYYISGENKIVINMLLRDSEKLSTLTHELGHAILHNDPKIVEKTDIIQVEFEADCLGIMLTNHLGEEIEDGRLRHFSDYYQSYKNRLENDVELPPLEQAVENAYTHFKNVVDSIDEAIQTQDIQLQTNLLYNNQFSNSIHELENADTITVDIELNNSEAMNLDFNM